MNRRASLLLVGLIAVLGIVNATIYTYRWITGTVNVFGPEYAAQYGCVGFYSAATQRGITEYLPNVGTNAYAEILGTGTTIQITPGDVACALPSAEPQYYLYESIDVVANLTVGSWYLQDIYGFGYYNEQESPNPVYVYIRLDNTTMPTIASTAYLRVYRILPDGSYGGHWDLDLLAPVGTQIGPIELPIGSALRIDFYVDAYTTGTGTFKLGFYITPEAGEPPSLIPSP